MYTHAHTTVHTRMHAYTKPHKAAAHLLYPIGIQVQRAQLWQRARRAPPLHRPSLCSAGHAVVTQAELAQLAQACKAGPRAEPVARGQQHLRSVCVCACVCVRACVCVPPVSVCVARGQQHLCSVCVCVCVCACVRCQRPAAPA